MNKYEEAYERLSSKEYHYPDYESVYVDIETLGELVRKETLKKIQFNIPQQPFLRKKYGKNARYDGICPSCHKSVFPRYKYCPDCGQRLDWGDDDE